MIVGRDKDSSDEQVLLIHLANWLLRVPDTTLMIKRIFLHQIMTLTFWSSRPSDLGSFTSHHNTTFPNEWLLCMVLELGINFIIYMVIQSHTVIMALFFQKSTVYEYALSWTYTLWDRKDGNINFAVR